MIFGSGLLTGLVPSAARGNCTSWSPESGVLLDANAGDYFPSFLRMNGFDHLVLYGKAPAWTMIDDPRGCGHVRGRHAVRRHGQHRHARGDRARHRRQVGAQPGDGQHHPRRRERRADERRDGAARKRSTRAAARARRWARSASRASSRSRRRSEFPTAQPYKPYNRVIAQKLLATSVVKNALSITGTPFLYKPSRLLGAMGTKNNQETTWTEALDAEHFDQYRPGMEGCFRCPVNCRPLNDLHKADAGQVRQGRRPRVRHARQVRSEPRHRQRRVGDSPQQHLQRSRPRHRVDRIGARVGVRAVSSAASSRPRTPAASSCCGATRRRSSGCCS